MKTQIKIILGALFLTILISLSPPINVNAYLPRIEKSQEAIDAAILEGFDYIAIQINEDGSVRWIDDSSSVAASIRVVQALAAAGFPQDLIKSDTGNRPIDFLAMRGIDWVNQVEADTPGFNAARAGQLLTAIAASNKNPRDFGDESANLTYVLNTHYDRNTGIYGKAALDNVLDQVWAMISLAANNESVPVEAADWLASAQAEDGSWNDGFGSFLDTTPLGVMALIGSNHYEIDSPSIQSALTFMARNQQDNGGWQSEWDTTTNPNTTGVMLQAISSLGQFPTDENWSKPEGNPLTALLATQQENGVFGGEFGNAYSTADAIIGLTGRNITTLGFLQASSEAFDYLIDNQSQDGGWGNVGQTIDVILALNAAGWNPNTFTVNSTSPLDFLSENLDSYIEAGPDAIGKTILGITAAGMDSRDFLGVDLGTRLMETYDESSRAFGSPENTWHQALGILGLYSAEMEIPQGAVKTLKELQMEDGGWEYSTGIGTSPDSTSLALQALIASGLLEEDQVIINGLEFLQNTQSADGGWTDSSTTSFAIMALNVLGQTSDMWTSDTGKIPVANLFSYQKANGAFVYSWEFPDDSIMSTASSLLAIFGGDYLIKVSDIPNENYVAIVIDPGDGAAQAGCVSFNEESISGLKLLEVSGFDYKTDQDGFINNIMGVTNKEGETNYWSYWYWDGREWQFQNIGAANTVVLPGTVEAWHFASWEQFPSLPPEYVPDINEICGEKTLADFSQQPHIDYNDLVPFALQEPVEFASPSEEPAKVTTDEPIAVSTKSSTIDPESEEDERIQSTPTTGEDQREDFDEGRSPLAIILIALVGTILLIVLTVLYLRRRQ